MLPIRTARRAPMSTPTSIVVVTLSRSISSTFGISRPAADGAAPCLLPGWGQVQLRRIEQVLRRSATLSKERSDSLGDAGRVERVQRGGGVHVIAQRGGDLVQAAGATELLHVSEDAV